MYNYKKKCTAWTMWAFVKPLVPFVCILLWILGNSLPPHLVHAILNAPEECFSVALALVGF